VYLDRFKLLAVAVLYSSLRVLYYQNNQKDIEIRNLVTFLK